MNRTLFLSALAAAVLLAVPALAATGYFYEDHQAVSEKASWTVGAFLTPATIEKLQSGEGFLRLVPAALMGEGRRFGALSGSLMLNGGKLKDGTVSCKYNAKKRSLKYSAKGASCAPFLIYDGDSSYAAQSFSSKLTLGFDTDLGNTMEYSDFYLFDEGRNLVDQELYFLPKGKKLVCKRQVGDYDVNASISLKDGRIKIALSSSACRDTLSFVNSWDVDMNYDYSLSFSGDGSFWANPVGPDMLQIYADDWSCHGAQVKLSDGRSAFDRAPLYVLYADTDIRAVFPRYQATFSIEGEGAYAADWTDEVTLCLKGYPMAGSTYGCVKVGGECYFDYPFNYVLKENTNFNLVFSSHKITTLVRGMGNYMARWIGKDTLRLYSPCNHFVWFMVNGQKFSGLNELELTLDQDVDLEVAFDLRSQLCYDIATGLVSDPQVTAVDYSDSANLTDKVYFSLVLYWDSQLGSFSDELEYSSDEPLHSVKLSKYFYMAQTEFTQGQYENILGEQAPGTYWGACRPVESLSYNQLRGDGWPKTPAPAPNSVLGRLRSAMGQEVDIPTEAQWESACRLNTSPSLNNGTWLYCTANALTNLHPIARYSGNAHLGRGGYYEHTTCAQYYPSKINIYDQHGNVAEWCRDWYGNYPTAKTTDPAGPATGSCRIVRGGSWKSPVHHCRAGYRNCLTPDGSYEDVGFRLIVEIEHL